MSAFDILTSKAAVAGIAPDAVPLTFTLPADEPRFAAVTAAAPERRWIQRPDATTGGRGDHVLGHPMEAEPSPRWVVQPADEAEGDTQRWSVVVPSLCPLEVYVLADDAPGPLMASLLARPIVAARDHALRADKGAADTLRITTVEGADGRCRIVEIDARAEGQPLDSGAIRIFPAAGTNATLTHPRPADLDLARSLGLPANSTDLRPAAATTWEVGDDLLVRSDDGKVLLLLNTAAAFVWLGLREGASPAELSAELAAHTGMRDDTIAADVDDAVGELADAGLLVTTTTDEPEPPAPRPAHVRWNVADVHELFGVRVSVRHPSIELATVARRMLPRTLVAGAADGDELAAAIEVVRSDRGWAVRAGGLPTQHLSSLYQVAGAVRRAAVASAAAAADGVVLRASALTTSQGAVLVGGPPEWRRELMLRWIAMAGTVLADAVTWVDPRGDVAPGVNGLVVSRSYQWIDGAPPSAIDPAAPSVGPDGQLVDLWLLPITAAAPRPQPAHLVVMPSTSATGLDPADRAETCRWLLAERYAAGDRASAATAAAIAECASEVAGVWGPADPGELVAQLVARGAGPSPVR